MSSIIKGNAQRDLLGGKFDEFFNNDSFFIPMKPLTKSPAVNIKETEQAYEIELAVPGVGKDEIEVNLKNDRLTVSFEHKEENETQEKNYLKREFSKQSFSRSFSMPEGKVDAESLDAKLENGVLHVNIPKKEAVATQRKIEVK